MTNKDELNTETSGLSSIVSEQAEENRAEDNAKLPLHPILADEEDAQDEVINTTAAEEQNLPKGDLLVDLDADNTETSSVAAVGNVSDANDVRDVAADKASEDKSDKKASAASAFSAFPLPDLREREDGGAIDFEEDEAPLVTQTTKVSDEVRSKSRAEFTTVYDIIDSMETTLSEAKNVLFAAGMVKIDRDEFVDQLARLKDMLPVQLERASALMREAERRLRTAQAQANSIVSSAQSQSAEIIEEAQERAQFLAGQENVTALAKQKARDILDTAQAKSDKLTQGADQYCANVMEGLKTQLDKLEQDVQAGRRVLEERRRSAKRAQDEIKESLYDNNDEDERND
ncbi:hypothetical protein CGSMWGv1500E_02087 [Gardnerella vaginalis 1500E]|uniref:Cell division initiation protein n=1 Tax=Gardnerella vaginalis 1500E TaxID=698957 RepID=I4M299_GARVA|nr:hypothetical protein [Gardnerella vaginalis]EIK83339.1 hypothetical protein CGSMWGv1500E_02087 [Gardnerella vaginalis 1500E]RIY18020.1 hypothetical protein CJI57_01865 [Bifidobacteriaceae bacterium WP012]